MPTENRFTDWNSWTVNGLTAHKHITTMDSALEYAKTIYDATAIRTIYCAIRAWKRTGAGVETEIGVAGTYKAQASGTPTTAKQWISGTWTYPTVAFVSTDCLVVKFYMRLVNNAFTEADLAHTFVTEQLGAQSLDTNMLSVIYAIRYTTPFYTHELYFGWYLEFGEYWANSYVLGWKWTAYVPPVVWGGDTHHVQMAKAILEE